MAKEAVSFLMFEGQAAEAMAFYESVFADAEIVFIDRFGPAEHGQEGTVKAGRMRVAGLELHFFDSAVKHAFTFTPSFSIFVTCESEAELDETFAKLAEGGTVLMPPDRYWFSQKFAWVNDRFGVSWQLNLEALEA